MYRVLAPGGMFHAMDWNRITVFATLGPEDKWPNLTRAIYEHRQKHGDRSMINHHFYGYARANFYEYQERVVAACSHIAAYMPDEVGLSLIDAGFKGEKMRIGPMDQIKFIVSVTKSE